MRKSELTREKQRLLWEVGVHDDDVREEGRAEGRAEGREEGEGQLVKLINSMIAGGDGDKIALFGEPEILKTMKKKYGIN